MTFKKVWQCGHCGSVYTNKPEANDCCCENEELGYQCKKCKVVFHHKPKGECWSCNRDEKDTLKVKEIIKNSELPIKKKELKKILRDYINPKRVDIILSHLESQAKIYIGKKGKGIVWTEASEKMKKALSKSVTIEKEKKK